MSIEINSVSHIYMEDTPLSHTALRDVSLTITEESFTAIAGETGAGKSTLMQMIGGLIRPTSGNITVDGVSLWTKQKNIDITERSIRFRVGMVFQYPEYQLFEETVYEDIAFGPRNQRLSEIDVEKRVQEAMDLLHLPQGYRDRSPFALSGGERRRAAIAGVLALAPRYLVLDEPTAGLDPRGREELLAMLSVLNREQKMCIILVSHSMEDILCAAQHLVLLADGQVIGEGAPWKIFRDTDLLDRASLVAPHLLRLGKDLEEIGYPVGNCNTISEMSDVLLAKRI